MRRTVARRIPIIEGQIASVPPNVDVVRRSPVWLWRMGSLAFGWGTAVVREGHHAGAAIGVVADDKHDEA